MKFAFLIMDDYGSGDRAQIANKNAQIIGVSDIEDAENAAKELQKVALTASSFAVLSVLMVQEK